MIEIPLWKQRCTEKLCQMVNMKTISSFGLACLSLLLIGISCKKQENNLVDVYLTGYDIRFCSCCGGVMINFDGDSTPYKGNFKLIDNVNDLDLGPNQAFPVHVKVSWKGTANSCSSPQHIIITKMIKL